MYINLILTRSFILAIFHAWDTSFHFANTTAIVVSMAQPSNQLEYNFCTRANIFINTYTCTCNRRANLNDVQLSLYCSFNYMSIHITVT